MTDKEKAIEAIEKAWEIINDKQPETTEEINLIRFAVNTARQLISKPTLDDAIAVVERYRDEQYKKWSDTFPKWAKYEDTPLMEHDLYYHAEGILNSIHDELTALKGLKEGK